MPSTDWRKQTREAADAFHHRFGRRPRFAAMAPGRVNLIGEHTDYNDGFVMPIAIERQTVIVADRADEPRVRLASMQLGGTEPTVDFAVTRPIAKGSPAWSNYVRGVVSGCLAAGLDFQGSNGTHGFDALIHSTVPVGSGLSSSAALEVAAATLIEALSAKTIDPVTKALLCQKAEHDYAGMPCGIMDQFISSLAQRGCAMMLDCRTHLPRMARISDPSVAVLVINTNVKHELTGSEYPQRRAHCAQIAAALGAQALRDVSQSQLLARRDQLDPTAFRRARHVVTENARVIAFAEALSHQHWDEAGSLMSASHASLRDDFEVSCAELDLVVELAQSIGEAGGVYGARMTGGGFGGCAVALINAQRLDAVSEQIAKPYRQRTGIEATIFATAPAEGAVRIDLDRL